MGEIGACSIGVGEVLWFFVFDVKAFVYRL